MAPITHQTVKLSRGKHSSPEEGACVMELASMLAGEPFTDHPASVCPVIGSFLRTYNDSIDDERRQDLYFYASRVVGSRASEEIEQARGARLTAWAGQVRRRWWSRLFSAGLQGLTLDPEPYTIWSRAIHALPRHDDRTHRRVLALVDELLSIGARGSGPPSGKLTPSAERACSL